jgi:phage terminase small subunit
MADLTEKQKRFADYYIESGNAEEAARRAGYNARGNTTKLLRNTTIRNYIDEHLNQMHKSTILSAEQVLEELSKIAKGKAKELGVKFVSAQDRNKALELLGKRYMLWVDRQQIDANIGVTIVDDVDED